MSSTEIAIYAVETKAIIHVLWGLLLISSISLIGVSITYVLLRIKLRSTRRRESQLARHVAAQKAELAPLQERASSVAALESEMAALKAQAKRNLAIRDKSEQRLVTQNAELETLRQQIAEQQIELDHLRAMIECGASGHPTERRRAA